MISFFRKLFSPKQATLPVVRKESFPARFHRFKLFLNAHINAYSVIMSFEERLANELPVGMPFLRMSATQLAIETMQCIMQLNALGENRYERLKAPYAALRGEAARILDQGQHPLEGPLLIHFREITEAHKKIISPNLYNLKAIRQEYPEFIPQGFIITGAAWWQYFNNQEMHEEIDRIMLISQEDPGSYGQAAARIREKIHADFPLHPDLIEAVTQALDELDDILSVPGYTILVRCFPVRAEHGALSVPEQIITTPITDRSTLMTALLTALSMSYRTRAMIYRLKLGIRDRAMPFCVSFTLLPGDQVRGGAYRNFENPNDDSLCIQIRRTSASTESIFQDPDNASFDIEAMLPEIEAKSRKALACLADAPVHGEMHEIYWTATQQGQFFIVGSMALADPFPLPDKTTVGQLAKHLQPSSDDICQLVGGSASYPGIVHSQPFVVRNLRDAMRFPIGAILVVAQAAPRWSFLLDFASGAIAAAGSHSGRFAQVARRRGRPTIIGQPDAIDILSKHHELTLFASETEESIITSASPEEISQQLSSFFTVDDYSDESSQDLFPTTTDGKTLVMSSRNILLFSSSQNMTNYLWLPSSDIAAIARQLAPKVALLTLPDSNAPDFRAENCNTFHDFITYCHDHAVQEMFHYGTSRKTAQAPAKQLVCDVPKQFWVINIADGFYGEHPGPTIPLDHIASLPMRALWEGFIHKPWDGPPQLDAKGFLSVLFEATQNPSLDPASQASQYTEKNVFLIAKSFCSMRCRFGFHFLSLDCLLGDRERERFIIFQFKGGAANIARRIKRVHFVAELLAQFEFSTEIISDTLTARIEQGTESDFISALRIIGYLVMHTRQLDMIMNDEHELAIRREQMLADMYDLADKPPLVLKPPKD